jgi:hypothetical protein
MNIKTFQALSSILPLIQVALYYRITVKNIIQWILNQSLVNQDEEFYLRNHGIKSALWLWVFHKIAYSLWIEVTQEMEWASFCISIIWTNLDKILDALPQSDNRFTLIVQYYTEVLTTWRSDICLPLQHPKFSELTILARRFYSYISVFPRKWEITKLVTDLSLAVNEQRNHSPIGMVDIEDQIYQEIKNQINSICVSSQTQKSIFLATRLWVTSVLLSFGISLLCYWFFIKGTVEFLKSFIISCRLYATFRWFSW